MRCLCAIDSIGNDVIFLNCDSEFNTYLQKEAVKLFGDDYVAADTTTPDINLATMFFLPFTTIQNKQHQQNNPLNSVLCQDGLTVALHRFDNIDVVAIDSDSSSKNACLSQCVVFEKLAKLHLGPATLYLKPSDLALRRQLWTKISDYLDYWNDVCGLSEKYLCSDDEYFSMTCEENFKQHFLFQAVEDLHINTELKRQATELVTEALQSAQKIDRAYCEAILVVNGKVLVSHSYRQAQRLDPSDLLFILFIAHCSLPKSPVEIDYGDNMSESEEMKHHQQNIFIRKVDQTDNYLPCTLTAVCIRAGIVLILLAETKTAIAPNICRAIQSLSQLYSKIDEIATETERGQHNAQINTKTLPTQFLKVKGVVDFYFARMEKDMENISTRLSQQWNKVRDHWYAVSTSAGHLGEENRYFHEFERKTFSLITDLRKLFYSIYCTDDESEIHKDINDIYKKVSIGLRDSSSFLLVKAQRNFTLGNYLSDFPGIVHFLVIDRTKNKIIVPSLGAQGQSARFCHKIIQTLARFHRNMVHSGYLGGFMKKKDMLFTYKLWFQNQGKVVSPETTVQYVPTQPRSQLLCMLYHNMVQHYFGARAPLVECFELLTIHIGEVPLEYVNDSATRLMQVVVSDFAS